MTLMGLPLEQLDVLEDNPYIMTISRDFSLHMMYQRLIRTGNEDDGGTKPASKPAAAKPAAGKKGATSSDTVAKANVSCMCRNVSRSVLYSYLCSDIVDPYNEDAAEDDRAPLITHFETQIVAALPFAKDWKGVKGSQHPASESEWQRLMYVLSRY